MAEQRRRKIVIVEDDPQIRSLVQAMLGAAGYKVVPTGEPTTAVDLVRAEDPDLVLCDIAMPVLDGYGVLRALQSDPTTARYPVVFLTAHREFSERVRAFRYGVVDYLSKPFSRGILLRKIEKVLEGLDRKAGSPGAAEGPASEILAEVTRDARSGVLTVRGEAGDEGRLVIRAGSVVEATGATATPGATAAFEEIDARREDIVTHDPARLPDSGPDLPTFDALPAVLKDVLLVDDNAEFRRFLGDLLRSRGFRVLEAASGDEALKVALQKRPWLIVTDVRMPGGDGFDFCRRVRAHSLVRQTPLLFLSGWDDYKQRYRGLELGADDFLSKGTSIRELLMRIQLLLARYLTLGRGRESSGMSGQVQVIGAPSVLQMCHLSRLTGVLSARDGSRRLEVRFLAGEIVGAESDTASGAEAVWEFLSWDRGGFEFGPAEMTAESALPGGFDALLLEGCRRLDEQGRGRAPAPGPPAQG